MLHRHLPARIGHTITFLRGMTLHQGLWLLLVLGILPCLSSCSRWSVYPFGRA